MEELFLKTPDVQSVSSLMYAAIDLVQRVHVAFDAGGLRISEEACQGNMFMFASLRAENFEEYTCKGAGVLCFNPEHLYRVLSNRQQRDVMTWTYKAPRRALVINVQSDDDGTLHEYTIPLENDLGESFEAPSIEVDYVKVKRTPPHKESQREFSMPENNVLFAMGRKWWLHNGHATSLESTRHATNFTDLPISGQIPNTWPNQKNR